MLKKFVVPVQFIADHISKVSQKKKIFLPRQQFAQRRIHQSPNNNFKLKSQSSSLPKFGNKQNQQINRLFLLTKNYDNFQNNQNNTLNFFKTSPKSNRMLMQKSSSGGNLKNIKLTKITSKKSKQFYQLKQQNANNNFLVPLEEPKINLQQLNSKLQPNFIQDKSFNIKETQLNESDLRDFSNTVKPVLELLVSKSTKEAQNELQERHERQEELTAREKLGNIKIHQLILYENEKGKIERKQNFRIKQQSISKQKQLNQGQLQKFKLCKQISKELINELQTVVSFYKEEYYKENIKTIWSKLGN